MIRLVLFVQKMLFDFEKIAIYDKDDNLLFSGYKKDFLEKNILKNYFVATFWLHGDRLYITVHQ